MFRTVMSQLPRLPVPDIKKTLDAYLRSVQPLLLADEHSGGTPFAVAYARQRALVKAFLDGPARRAQARLRALDTVSPHNWLDDNFWMKKTYLAWRAPLLVNSNWWLAFVNDPNVPSKVVKNRAEGITPWQVRRAACLVHGILDFKHRMHSQDLYPDTTRIGLWLGHCTSQIFNICRLPQHPSDALTVPAPPSSPWASTITVLAHDHYYALRVADPATGVPLHVDEIERGMRGVVTDVLHRRRSGELPVEIGVLSADDRDEWSRNYSTLLSISPENKHSFEAIHHSLFVVSLDHWPSPSVPADQRDEKLPLTFDTDQHTSLPLSQSSQPLSTVPSDLLAHQYAIRSSPSALNRFLDKPLSLIVEPSTRAGAMGEHSPVDALIPSVVCEWAVAGANGVNICGGLADVPLENNHQEGKLEGLETGSGPRWARLNFVSSPSIQVAIENAKRHAETLVSNSDHQVSYFEEWGGEEMKRVSSYQPDAFVQLALQLAYFRIHQRPTPVYETALTRSFQHGRTETIRSFTTESYAFLRASAGWTRSAHQTRSEPSRHLYPLLESALKVHSLLARSAMMGRGIDRHLLGLRCILSDEWAWLDNIAETSSDVGQDTTSQDTAARGQAASQPVLDSGTSVPLFEDAIFLRSQEWRLSTSGLSEGWWFRGTGFGSPYEDGYGINYLIGPHAVKFCVESKHSCPTTSTHVFIEHVADALRDMREICLSANKSGQAGESVSANTEAADVANAGAAADHPSTDKRNNGIRPLGDSILAKPRL
ncbi:acyltransferase ChoActase/COT/CPT [Boletus edulis BED1]|uniref:Acyltransferase ChoActase/COT/CPT n=1 Tax=Boletus edulis BED1 TaxID=1328754 RepID=A0AAD4BV32_BOLED|nr:acyltransferase ChoActase/COT/CPT [Boletus edulis BED1]